MTPLCTLSKYRLLTSEVTSTDPIASSLLDSSSGAIRNWLRRDLDYKTSRDWLELNGNCADVFLPEWPVRRVRMLGGLINLGTLRYEGDLSAMPSIESTLDRLVLMQYVNGLQEEHILDYATYPTWSVLSAAIQAVSGWKIYTSSIWDSYPTRLIRPVGGISSQGIIIEGVLWTGIRYKLLDERRLELDGIVGNWCYVEWDAGYNIPTEVVIDSSSSSSSPTVIDASIPVLPEEIQYVCAQVARDMFTLSQTNGGMKRSETVKNYSYTLSPDAKELLDLVQRYAVILSKYRKIGFR